MTESKTKKQRGRPRAFDIDTALLAAMDVFRHKGYEGTSITDLTQALGLNRPSLYAAFGNKDALFIKVLNRYMHSITAYVDEVLEEKSTRVMVQKLLLQSIDTFIFDSPPKGCLAILSSVSSELSTLGIQQKLASTLMDNIHHLEQRLALAIQEGDLPEDADPAALAHYIATIHRGLSIQVSNGVAKNELVKVVEQVMKTWPGK